jgi:ribosome-associated translation inhibitor RaiA
MKGGDNGRDERVTMEEKKWQRQQQTGDERNNSSTQRETTEHKERQNGGKEQTEGSKLVEKTVNQINQNKSLEMQQMVLQAQVLQQLLTLSIDFITRKLSRRLRRCHCG